MEVLMLKLDFTIETSEERAAFVSKYIEALYNPTEKELETIANYILYGKDPDGKSSVDRKEIQIETKYKSYNRKAPQSLEALLENPYTDPIIRDTTRYKSPKPTITLEDNKIPGMVDLWHAIDSLEKQLTTAQGKRQYHLNHYLISLRQQQYVLKEIQRNPVGGFNPCITPGSNSHLSNDVDWITVLPLGLYTYHNARFSNISLNEPNYSPPSTPYFIDFRNITHVKLLSEYHDELAADEDPESFGKQLAETLDWYAARANLRPPYLLIWELKKQKRSNLYIQNQLGAQYDKHYSLNYISTLYNHKICGAIASAAIEHEKQYLARQNWTMWKFCESCGEEKLRNGTYFSHKRNTIDGYSKICKECEKKKRMEANNGS